MTSSNNSIDIDLNKLVPKNFRKFFKHILDSDLYRAVAKGGRSSAKSTVIAIAIVVLAMQGYSSLCLIKYQNKIKERLVNQFLEVLRYMNLTNRFKLRRSPFELVLLDVNGKETQVSVMFAGCEDPYTLKGIKPRQGSFRVLWFEEADYFTKNDFDVVEESALRGEGQHICVMSYNPPESTAAYINQMYGNAPVGKVLGFDKNSYTEVVPYVLENGKTIYQRTMVHHSSYQDLIDNGCGHFIGDALMAIITESKINDQRKYRHHFLGEVVGGLANVFPEIIDWEYVDMKPEIVYRGIDFSNGGPDQHCYVETCLNGNDLYILKEVYTNDPLESLVPILKKANKWNATIFSDGAVPYFTQALQSNGINVVPAKKGADSVRAGILYLQGLRIHIDPMHTPNIYKDFKELEYKVDKNGNITSQIQGRDHGVDATRYALNEQIILGE